MIITLVIDTFGATNNGTTVTCMRTATYLKKHGHEVRVIAYVPEEHDDLSSTSSSSTTEWSWQRGT